MTSCLNERKKNMSRLEEDLDFIAEATSEIAKDSNVDEKTASSWLLYAIAHSYLKDEGEIDVYDLVLSYIALGCRWTEMFSLKIFHDIYHSPLFEEVTETSRLWMIDEQLAKRAPFSIAERYFDLFYKKGGEDTDTFLWRCLCLGCFPDESFLRKSEEEKRATFTKDMRWHLFTDLFSLSDEERELAIATSKFNFIPAEDDVREWRVLRTKKDS